jgi:hypothetical protein
MDRMAITSEQTWEVAAHGVNEPGDTFVLGRPATRIIGGEPARLMRQVDWNRIARSATVGFFEYRDPGCSVRSTVAKILSVIVVVAMISLVTVVTLAALGIWAIDAIVS